MKIKIKKLHPYAAIPSYAKLGDAGMDLTAIAITTETIYDENGDIFSKIITSKFGISVEIPEGFVGLIFPRSSIYKTGLSLSNSVGVIDSGYRGELMVKFNLLADEENSIYKPGDRVAQLIILPYPQIEFEEVSELSSTERGEGGFGSTNI
jgi:dUTP pyrophosphatase